MSKQESTPLAAEFGRVVGVMAGLVSVSICAGGCVAIATLAYEWTRRVFGG